jgi:RNA polymerase primary sigma factor
MKQLKIGETFTNTTPNIDRYFIDMRSEKGLTSKEEVDLAQRIKSGDKEALDTLIKSNLRFVVSIAKQYSVNGDMLAELISQGNIGLIDAAKTFDETRGFKFISYAVWHIRKEILKYLESVQRTVRIPGHVNRALSQANKVEIFLANKLGRAPTIAEIADELERNDISISEENLAYMVAASAKGVPLESNDPDEEFAPINWLASSSEPMEDLIKDDRLKVFELLSRKLTALEKEVIALKFGFNSDIGMSYSSISERFGCSPEWARTLYLKAIKKMKLSAKQLKNKI